MLKDEPKWPAEACEEEGKSSKGECWERLRGAGKHREKWLERKEPGHAPRDSTPEFSGDLRVGSFVPNPKH